MGTCKDNNGLDNKFEAFSLTEANSKLMTEDMDRIRDES